jgi:hypothetical protein
MEEKLLSDDIDYERDIRELNKLKIFTRNKP